MRWRCDGGDAGVSGGVSHLQEQRRCCSVLQDAVQPSGTGQGSPPVAAGVPVPLTSPNSPFELFPPSPPESLAGRSKAVSMCADGCFSSLLW